jgi:RHS repeat-associated protein
LPYGEQVAGDTGSTHKFTGKERDAETNLDYFGARYYASSLGRFLSSDPVLFKNSWKSDPQRINLYAYVRNNPLLFFDPDGRELKIYILNNSGYSNSVAKQIGEKAADRFREAGVKNVSTRVVNELPASKGELQKAPNTATVELIGNGNVNSVREGETGTLGVGVIGENFGNKGVSLVDANARSEPGQSVEDVVSEAGSDVAHEVAHEYLEHSADPANPMYPSGEAVDAPFSPDQAQKLQQQLNKPGEVEKQKSQQQGSNQTPKQEEKEKEREVKK